MVAQTLAEFGDVRESLCKTGKWRPHPHWTRDASRDIKPMPGPPPRGDRAATPAERPAAYKATAADLPAKPPAVIRYRRAADRRSRPQQWADAVQTLAGLLDQFEEWRDNLPSGLANSSATAEALDAVLELRGHVEDLHAAELPKGFGRD